MLMGGESGPRARAMDPAWVLEIRDQYLGARVPFFFKQWGGTQKKKAGRELDGRMWDEMPALDSAVALWRTSAAGGLGRSECRARAGGSRPAFRLPQPGHDGES